ALYGSVSFQDPLSFPTRRSSDLAPTFCLQTVWGSEDRCGKWWARLLIGGARSPAGIRGSWSTCAGWRASMRHLVLGAGQVGTARSEEHTSELQSRENLVCRLLLE